MEPLNGSDKSMLGAKRRLVVPFTEESRRWDGHGIDARAAERLHARVVVRRRVHAVHPEGVDTQRLEKWQISSAAIAVSERVNESRGLEEGVVGVFNDGACKNRLIVRARRTCSIATPTLWLVCYTLDEEPAPICVVEIFSLSADFLDSS